MSTPATSRTLQRLYLTLFLRGRTSRGLKLDRTPRSVGTKLAGTLALYALVGLAAIAFARSGAFALSFYLHGMTLLFLGMFVAASAGEVLFNKDEPEILLHRPVEPRALLWAKVAVMVRVSLWVACAFNLAGLVIGAVKWNPLFIPAHLASTGLAALFCTGSVVLLYQLCLRWFGRERLDNLMTTAQVLLAIGLVAGSQMVPYLLQSTGGQEDLLTARRWIVLLPPAWFAGLDALITGRFTPATATLAATGIVMTTAVLSLAVGKMAAGYDRNLRGLAESRPRAARDTSRPRWYERLAKLPPFALALRDPVVHASYRLCAAYLLRDRDMKLRLYPGLAPMMVMPAVVLLQGKAGAGREFAFAMAGGYLGLIPLMALGMLQYSQQWQAADLYRLAPVPGPGRFIFGAVAAVAILLVLPASLALVAILACLPDGSRDLPLVLPGLIALPAFALAPGLVATSVPLAKPTEEAKSAMRGAPMFLLMMAAMILPGIAIAARKLDGFGVFLAVEAAGVAAACALMIHGISRKRWEPLE